MNPPRPLNFEAAPQLWNRSRGDHGRLIEEA
jgi:hypothetical protein